MSSSTMVVSATDGPLAAIPAATPQPLVAVRDEHSRLNSLARFAVQLSGLSMLVMAGTAWIGQAWATPSFPTVVGSSSLLSLPAFQVSPTTPKPEADDFDEPVTASSEISRFLPLIGVLGQASMTISVGRFSAFSSTTQNQGGAFGGVFYSSEAGGGFNETIMPITGGPVGTHFTMVVPIHLTGSIDVSIIPGNTASASFDFSCNANVDFASSTSCGAFHIGTTASQAVDQTFLMTIPLVIGHESEIFTGFDLRTGFFASPGFVAGGATFDLSHTGVFEPAEIFDLAGNQVFDVQITSGSGFNYLAGAAAPAVAGVPEPATVTLLGTGLLGLYAARRRRRS